MKIIKNATLYKCGFCKKYLIRKHAMENHEFNCFMNPKNQSACSGCAFLEETTIDYIKEGYDGDDTTETKKTAKSFKCSKLNKILYPFGAVRKGIVDKYPETFQGQEQMPNKCDHWYWTKEQ